MERKDSDKRMQSEVRRPQDNYNVYTIIVLLEIKCMFLDVVATIFSCKKTLLFGVCIIKQLARF